MHITNQQFKKEFDKLGQLDRIEFRQKFYKLQEDKRWTNAGMNLFLKMLGIIAFVVIFDIYNVLHGHPWLDQRMYIFLLSLAGLGYIIVSLIELFFVMKADKELNELIKAYFDFEVKKRK